MSRKSLATGSFVLMGVVAVALNLTATLFHEMVHVFWAYLETGTVLWNCGDIGPVGVWTDMSVIPRFYACVPGSGAEGVNELVATMLTAAVGVGLILRSSSVSRPGVRRGMLLSGSLLWFQYSLYGAGLWYIPTLSEAGDVVMTGGHDGFDILAAFGYPGMIPGVMMLSIGGVILWERLRDSKDACACALPRGTDRVEWE